MLNQNIKWAMLVIGVITCSMLFTALSPVSGVENTFGDHLDGELANIIVSSWAMLITITGGLLIYGAFYPVHRKLVIVAACVSKTWFVGLNLVHGQEYMGASMPTLVFDSIAVLLLLACLFAAKASDN